MGLDRPLPGHEVSVVGDSGQTWAGTWGVMRLNPPQTEARLQALVVGLVLTPLHTSKEIKDKCASLPKYHPWLSVETVPSTKEGTGDSTEEQRTKDASV